MKNKQNFLELLCFAFLLSVFFSCSEENSPDYVEISFSLENGIERTITFDTE
jgi:hypothetical protein